MLQSLAWRSFLAEKFVVDLSVSEPIFLSLILHFSMDAVAQRQSLNCPSITRLLHATLERVALGLKLMISNGFLKSRNFFIDF